MTIMPTFDSKHVGTNNCRKKIIVDGATSYIQRMDTTMSVEFIFDHTLFLYGCGLDTREIGYVSGCAIYITCHSRHLTSSSTNYY